MLKIEGLPSRCDWGNDDSTLMVTSQVNDVDKLETHEVKTYWNARTGEQYLGQPPSAFKPPQMGPSPFDEIVYQGSVMLRQTAMTPAEIERRKHILAPQPDWHSEQALKCEREANWFAAAFHLRRLPLNEVVNRRLQAATAKLAERETAPPPRH